ncbi:hypothetical protein GH714_007922 [Hevea brasiliensis]|uniref:F-box domain-containing protein n=1 Tax=Hevea brasiliensis TaxID=3981 RepID=A0A6A6LYV9_HEVBR|nr:hypothetical protein GH714_007922 [Hevea brasiliensis]
MESRDFNLDIIFEILSRSSLKTLARCRLLSKEINSLTYQSAFLNLHCPRTKTISGYFVQSLRLRHPQAKVFCFVVIIGRIPRYYVCKPSTEEWQIIPNPKTRYFTEGFAMIVLKSNPLHYRIVRFSRPLGSHKRQRISIECLREIEKYTNPDVFYNADVALMRGFYKVIFFKFKNGNSADIVTLDKNINMLGTEVFPFKSDFEPSNLKNEFCRGQTRRRKSKKRAMESLNDK